MSDYQGHLQTLRKRKASKRGVALFDLDRTLISVYSALPLLLEQVKTGQVSYVAAIQQLLMAIGQSQEVYEFEEVLKTVAEQLENRSEQEFSKLGSLLFHKHLQKKVYIEAQELVDSHRQLGHHLVIVSSATRYQIEPVAEALGIDNILCTELEVVDGKFTGALKGPACWAKGKLTATQSFCKTHKLNLKNSWFYTDALEDLPLLNAVTHPVAVNPSESLAEHAKIESWPILEFRSRSRASLMDIARTGAMFGSVVPTAWLGLASRFLGSGDKRQTSLSSFTTYADVALELAGVKLEVKNEKYLWEKRPAIFVINHQSILDGFITPKLVKKDYFMMGKKEARNVPLLGKVLEDAGFILFDRGDREAALAACDEAAERIKQGYSLCISPEGTRSYNKRLEPFKKGAFHIALQTGVPIVPIVVKNAAELWPRGQQFVRPGTLHIEILKPVSTKNWTKSTLPEHLDALYHSYLEALDSPY
ncbi:MAG: HAD-IB family hydrolase [Pseudomonadales bacterium]